MKLTFEVPNDINDMNTDDIGKIYTAVRKLVTQLEIKLSEKIDESRMTPAYNKMISDAVRLTAEYDSERSDDKGRVFEFAANSTADVSKVLTVTNPRIKANSLISIFPSPGYEGRFAEFGYYVCDVTDGQFKVRNVADKASPIKFRVLIHKEAMV